MSDKPINHHPLPTKSATAPTVIGWTIIIAYLITSIIFIGYYATTPSRMYKKGVESYNEGDYKQAFLQFRGIDEHYISIKHYKNSLDFYNDSAYRYASELIGSNEEDDLRTARAILYGEDYKTNLVEANYGESRVLAFKVAQVGDTVYFGEYNENPIGWIVSNINENGYLRLIAKEIVERKEYDETEDYEKKITWQNSSLRLWLNSSFYNQAFSSTQKNAVISYYDNINECYDYVSLPTSSDISAVYGYYRSIVSDDFWLYSYGDSDIKNVIEYKKVDTSNYFGTFGVKPVIWVDPAKVTEV